MLIFVKLLHLESIVFANYRQADLGEDVVVHLTLFKAFISSTAALYIQEHMALTCHMEQLD